MISLRKRYKTLLVIGIIFISIYSGMKKSSVLDFFSNKTEVRNDFKEATKEFNIRENFKKVQMDFLVGNINEFYSQVNDVLKKYNIKYGIDNAFHKKNYGTSASVLIEIPDSVSTPVISGLKQLSGFRTDNIQNLDKEIEIDIEARIENAEFKINDIKKRIEDDKTTGSYREKYSVQLEFEQNKLDSLRFLEKKFSYAKTNNLIFFRVFLDESTGNSIQTVKKFLLHFLTTFFALTALLFFAYFALSIVLRLMSYFGIRNARSSGRYSSYYKKSGKYGYGSYGGYNRRRKIKRVYKDPESNKSDDKE